MTGTIYAPTSQHEPIGEEVTLSGGDWTRRIHWHDATRLGTPAFWVDQSRHAPEHISYRVGTTLAEETALCILGGHGVTKEMAYASFERLQNKGLLEGPEVNESSLLEALQTPYVLRSRQKPVRYRFPKLKAERIAGALKILHSETPPSEAEPRELRNWLTQLPGVGLKTASWAVRNITQSDDIAIIDIHIRRAGVVAGVFDSSWKLPRDYLRFEEAFVAWAQVGRVPTAQLDLCIWSQLAEVGRGARFVFGVSNLHELD